THSHFLHEHPHALLPLAQNQAATGFLAERTAAPAAALRRPWIARERRPAALPLQPVCQRVLKGHTAPVAEVALSGDGRFALSAGQDGTLRFWDIASGECLRTLANHVGQVNAIALTPDGHRAVSAGTDKTVRIWRLPSGECEQTLHGHTAPV